MIKSIKVRLYPNKAQSQLLNQHFGSVRFLYNMGLEYKKRMYTENGIKLTRYDLINELPKLKEEIEWLKECKAECLQSTYDNLDKAFVNFYNGSGYPKFKSRKSSNQSFVQKQNIRFKNDKIVFLGNRIKFKCSDNDREFLQSCKPKFITYTKDNLNNYYASITFEHKSIKKAPLNNSVGIDLGISNFIVTSDGEFIENPKFYRKSEKKLKKLQRKNSKCKKGSKNREKARIRYAKAAKKVADKRNYFLHSVANKLINENQVISFETLNVSGMMKNHKLAKSVHDAAWTSLVQIVSYKAEWYGREVNKIGRFVPSSKTCSACGEVNNELTLKNRVFECTKCGHKEDRDLNASKNIKNFSRDELTRINASGETVTRHSVKEEDTIVS